MVSPCGGIIPHNFSTKTPRNPATQCVCGKPNVSSCVCVCSIRSCEVLVCKMLMRRWKCWPVCVLIVSSVHANRLRANTLTHN